MAATTSDRPTVQQHAISATLMLAVPAGILALWLQERWIALRTRF
jgi:hypothetical protein